MNIEFANIPDFQPKPINLPEPAFLSYKPDFEKIEQIAAEYQNYKNVLVIGHGGSITSFMGMAAALGANKRVAILSTVDPEYVAALKNDFAKEQTLVIAISKSGETVTQIEALLHFIDYPMLLVAGSNSTLAEIGLKNNAKVVEHPAVGGRYTAFTEVGLLPAAICGIDIRKMYAGAELIYAQYRQDNMAGKAAQTFYALEQNGIVDVFMPFYSHYLFPFSNLIVQLCHESFGKAGLGQTYFAHEAPESQHHTNQRFFGGRKNIAGFFVHLDGYRADSQTIVPTSMHSINFKDGHLFALNKLPLSFSMDAEFRGTYEDAKINNIPLAALSVSAISEQEIGYFIAFWQLYAVYSSLLRGVDPFDQPQVESSKKISWAKRKTYGAAQ